MNLSKFFLSCGVFACAGALAFGQSQVTITLSGSDHGRVFEGVGAVSAGASSRLLVDYQDPYRSDILDYLFKPKFGAGFQHLKVEIGGGENSTCGSEPTHANTRAELSNPKNRGYELWLMREARARNPHILLDCLPWTFPAWIKNPFTQDGTDWFIAFLDLAKKQHTPLNWVAAAWNERGTNRDWIVKSLRPTLDTRGYKDVLLQAPDNSNGFWTDFDKYGNDAAYQSAVKAVGYHYVNGREPWTVDEPGYPATEKAKASGKPLWDSEEWSQSGRKWGGSGANYVARMINKLYIRDRITKTEVWCPIASIYPELPWHGTGPMEAISPWSGHYEVWPGVWAIAHTTQFAQPGWQYLDGACGQISPTTWNGTYVTLKDPVTGDWSTIVCTDTPTQVTFKIGNGLKRGEIHAWSSNAKEQFVKQADLTPDANGVCQTQLEGNSIYSFTTTTGQTKGSPPHPIPAERPFPFPFHEDFKSYASGQTPRYFSDQKGTFETVNDPAKGMCLTQIAPQQGLLWQGGLVVPYTVFGDHAWTDYMVSADAKIVGGQVEIGGRYLSNHFKTLSYRFILEKTGEWKLNYQEATLAAGKPASFDSTAWHHLQLVFRGPHIEGWIDGKKLADVQDTKSTHGMVTLGCSYDPNLFANIAITPPN